MLRRDNYELVSPIGTSHKEPDTTAYDGSFSGDPLPSRALGEPAQKPLFNIADCIAVLTSFLCLALAIGAISPALRYAAELQYTRQIIILGFLLGIMNQCLQRVMPHMSLLVEARFGSSTIQNYDGILRWTPLADKMSFVWRAVLIVLLILPLALSIVYKRFTGGIGVIDVSGNGTFYTPTFPYGLSNSNVGDLTAIANVTAPFMAATANDSAPFNNSNPQAYGYNLLLLSDTSAAAVDAPNQLYIKELQHQLPSVIRYNLTARVRGTVATFNNTVETHRDDESFWNKYLGLTKLALVPLPGSVDLNQVGLLHLDSAGCDLPECYDASWAFLGVFTLPEANSNSSVATSLFEQVALGFDISRHDCTVTWEITANSMELVSGHCNPEPLDSVYQYLKDCQTFFTAAYYMPLAGDCVGSFASSRNQSHWRIPTYAAVTATMFWSKIAGQNGYIAVQAGGYIYDYWNGYSQDPVNDWQSNNMLAEAEARGGDWKFNETYARNHTLLKQVPTIKPEGTLYLVLIIQPVLTLIAFLVALMMYGTPMSQGFGMVSVLAGVDKKSVDLLSGATFSGRLKIPMGLRIKVRTDSTQEDDRLHRVEYIVGERGSQGEVRFRTKYN
jgi:hypothetical protein